MAEVAEVAEAEPAEPAAFKRPSRPLPAAAGPGDPGPSPPAVPRTAGAAPPAPRYEEPPWGSRPPAGSGYGLEVLKGGVLLGSVRLEDSSWFLVGRLPGCALSLEHPSVSRHHAVLQYRGAGCSPDDAGGADAAGFYVYDLGSTHGTFLNKARVPPRTYCRVRVGHGLRFGGSSRLFLLQVRRGSGPGGSGRVRVVKAGPDQAQEISRLRRGDCLRCEAVWKQPSAALLGEKLWVSAAGSAVRCGAAGFC